MSNTIEEATRLLHNVEAAAKQVGLQINTSKTEYISYHHDGEIKSLAGKQLKSVTGFVYLGSQIASTEQDVKIRIGKAWGALNKLTTIWKSSLPNNIKRDFFRATVETVLVYGATTWTLTKKLEQLIRGSYTRMLRAALNVHWKQHWTNEELYGGIPPITSTIKERRIRFAGHCWRSKDELAHTLLLWQPRQGSRARKRPAKTYIDQLEEDTGQKREDLPIMMSDERSGKTVSSASEQARPGK